MQQGDTVSAIAAKFEAPFKKSKQPIICTR
ncbi:hypothetical protein QUF84_13325 [Fictibacillus enclensis]|nr:hypothetical protein [Fictibacillus enclensis]